MTVADRRRRERGFHGMGWIDAPRHLALKQFVPRISNPRLRASERKRHIPLRNVGLDVTVARSRGRFGEHRIGGKEPFSILKAPSNVGADSVLDLQIGLRAYGCTILAAITNPLGDH